MAKRITIELLAMVALGLLLGLIGPFGTFAMPTAERMAMWAAWLIAGYLVFRPAGIGARWLCEATGLPAPVGTALALGIGAFVLTLIIATMSMGVGFPAVLRWDGFWWLGFYILIVSGIVTVTMTALFGRGGADPRDPTAVAMFAATAISDHAPTPEPDRVIPPLPSFPLPPDFGPVRALKGEDHYVRVIGEVRDELILMRLRDAIQRLGDADGLHVHRSWWVAKNAVASVRREGRTAMLILHGGQTVPVAREQMPRLRAAGWL